jgi:hypothetical protein
LHQLATKKKKQKVTPKKKGGEMRLSSIGKFSLKTIAGALGGSDLKSARSSLSFAYGSFLDVSGKVQKVVKRDGKY